MIGRETPEAPGLDDHRRASAGLPGEVPSRDAAVRWGMGCLVGAVALAGVVVLAALLALYLQPPAWVQIVLGVVLALGAVLLAWLVAAAWGRAASARERTGGGDADVPRDIPRSGGSLPR